MSSTGKSWIESKVVSALVIGAVTGLFILLCFGGLWPLAIGLIIGIPAAAIVMALMQAVIVLLFLGIDRLASKLPAKPKRFATQKPVHGIVFLPVGVILFGILYLIFRDASAIIGGIATGIILVIFLVGIPTGIGWVVRRLRKFKQQRHHSQD